MMGVWENFRKMFDFKGSTFLYQPYTQWQFRLNDMVTFNTGLHFLYLSLNGTSSIEPRFGVKWQFTPKQTFSVGYGLHSQMSPLYMIQAETLLPNGKYIKQNEELGFTKSHHFIVGYDLNISETVRLKLEAYYQSIFDAVVEVDSSSYSSLNFGSFSYETPEKLNNGGTGYNYGVEMTLEKFMDKGLYFLMTLSLFESKYEGSDGIERNTVFNGNYVYNLLAGKEFSLKSKKKKPKNKKAITVDTRFNIAGGQRYTPLDMVKSAKYGRSFFDDDLAFSEQLDNYIVLDGNFGYKVSGKKTSQVFVLSVKNITNHQNPLYHNFDGDTGEIEIVYQTGVFPMLFYRITF